MEELTNLHAQIMNIPAWIPDDLCGFEATSEQESYQRGHRDARHAAAELVASLSSGVAASPPQPQTLTIYRAKIHSRKRIDATIPRELQGWWADVCPGQTLMLRDATEADLKRCCRKPGDTRGPGAFLCELPADGSLVAKLALEYCHPMQVPVNGAHTEGGVRVPELELGKLVAALNAVLTDPVIDGISARVRNQAAEDGRPNPLQLIRDIAATLASLSTEAPQGGSNHG